MKSMLGTNSGDGASIHLPKSGRVSSREHPVLAPDPDVGGVRWHEFTTETTCAEYTDDPAWRQVVIDGTTDIAAIATHAGMRIV